MGSHDSRERSPDLVNGNDFTEKRYLLPALLLEVADQVPERMHIVWFDAETPSGHPFRAVCGYNASLSLEWGRRSSFDGEEELRGSETTWSQKYPNPEVWREDLDILLHGAVIYRLEIASVDGGRCRIPFPSPSPVGDGLQISSWK